MIRSVRLDDQTNELLERAARESGVSPSEYIRQSIKRTFRAPGPQSGRSLSARIRSLIQPLDRAGTAGKRRTRKRSQSSAARRSSEVYADWLVEKHERRQRTSKGRRP